MNSKMSNILAFGFSETSSNRVFKITSDPIAPPEVVWYVCTVHYDCKASLW